MSYETRSIVLETLLKQREVWREIVRRVEPLATRALPPEAPKRILLFGVGSSFFAAKLTAYTLRREQDRYSRIPILSCPSLSIGTEIDPRPGDWAFGITHRGGTRATIDAFESCLRAGAFTCAVTGKGAKEIGAARFSVETSEQERCEPHTMSMSGAVCAITTLLMGERATKQWHELSMDANPEWGEMRDRAGLGPSVVLGEWEGEWLAKEAGLKLMEMARMQVRTFGTEEYFHGPRLARKPQDTFWHFACPEDSRNGDVAGQGINFKFAIDRSASLSWVRSLVQAQWAALAVAMNRGVDPDGKE